MWVSKVNIFLKIPDLLSATEWFLILMAFLLATMGIKLFKFIRKDAGVENLNFGSAGGAQVLNEVRKQLLETKEMVGEVKALASNLGTLEKIFQKPASRGAWGEMQLRHILETLIPAEFRKEKIAIHPELDNQVDFAIQLPGSSTSREVLLPIDAKFTLGSSSTETTTRTNDQVMPDSQAATKPILVALKKEAASIQKKYIHPPWSTDFALLFLPSDTLYCQILAFPERIHEIFLQHKVFICAPCNIGTLIKSIFLGLDLGRGGAQITSEYVFFQLQKTTVESQIDELDLAIKAMQSSYRKLKSVKTSLEDNLDEIEGVRFPSQKK